MADHTSSTRWAGPLAILAALVLFVAVNVIASAAFQGRQLDLTQNKLFTVSDGTATVLQSLDEPVRMRFYFSSALGREIPAYGAYAERVRTLLRRYAALSGGMLRLDEIDPEPFSEEEDRAVAFGLQGVPLDQDGALVYFGLVGSNALDDVEVVPFFQPEREERLEYDLTTLVDRLSARAKPVVGIMTDLPVRGGPIGGFGGPPQQAPSWLLFDQLDDAFDTKPISTDADRIDDDVSVLLLVHPQGLSESALYAIDQFVMRGGRLMAFVDPLSEAQQAIPPGAPGRGDSLASDLPALFERWGVVYDPTQGVADAVGARRVATRESQAQGRTGVNYLAWVTMDRRNMGDDLITGDLERINIATAGSFSLTPDSPLNVTPLFTSSPEAAFYPISTLEARADPEALLNGFLPSGTAYVQAARLTGPLETAFPDGRPARPEDEAAEADGDADAADDQTPHLTATDAPATILLFADTDFLRDAFWVNRQNFFGQELIVPVAQNATLVANAVETLSGSDALISLRSRAASQRPFLLIEAMAREADRRFLAEEQELRAKLANAEQRLSELQGGDAADGDGAVLLNDEQRAAIAEFQDELIATRGALRDVQRKLRADVERAETITQIVNIAAAPALVILLAIGLAAA
ncbi:MAG: Gldg family protein, partial [Pseudomonadota bacterium]